MSTSRKRRSSGKEEAEGSSREEKGAEGGRGGGRRILRARTTVYYDDEGEGDIKAGSDSTYNPSSDGESEKNEEESDPTSVGKKYHTAAANAVDNALKKVLLKCNCSARIVDLCDIGNESIINETAGLFKSHKEMKKGIAFPTCVSVNRNICHFSPLSSDTSTLEDKDIVKMYYVYATQPTIPPPSLPPLVTTMKLNVNFLCDSEMAAHVNGYVAIVAHTIEIRKDDDAVRGRAADVIAAANAVAELLTQQIRPRILMKNIFGDLEHIVNEYDCKFIRMNIYEPKRFLIGCEEHDICFQEDRVYVIDIITSTGEGKPEELDQSHTTVFEVDENAKDELEGEYLVAFNKIHEKFHVMPFTTRGLETDLDVESMQKYHEMLKPYPVLYAKEGELTAHVKFTVLLKTDKLVKITPSPKYQKLLPLRSFDEPLLGMDENSAASKNDKGKGLELVYCGMLPVGEEGLGPAPIIESISWNTTLKEEHGDEGLAFLCSGSFGTYCYSRSLSVENNDIQCGWEKKLILIAPAKRCSWNPKFRDIIAIGTVPDLGTGQIFKRGHVHIMNLNASKEITFDKPNYEGWSSLGVNSLCWSRSGAHLLFAGDHTDSVGIITMKEKNKSIKCWVAQVHYRVYKLDKGHKADVVGAFHPFMDQFAMATSSGIINVHQKKSASEIKKGVASEWDLMANRQAKLGIQAIQYDRAGTSLICGRTDGSIMVYGIGPASEREGSLILIQQLHALEGLLNVNFVTSLYGRYLATVNRAQVISIYNSNNGVDRDCKCVNRDNINPTKRCTKNDALEWVTKKVLVSGGDDGFLYFWMLLPQGRKNNTFKARKRDFFLEKTFYSRKRASLTSSETIQTQCTNFATQFSAFAEEVKTRENQRNKALQLVNGGLNRIYRGEQLTQEEMQAYFEEIGKSLRF